MLVLSRKIQEAIVIGDEVRVTVLSISASRVSIGVAAPGEVAVHRAEVYRRIADAPAAQDSPGPGLPLSGAPAGRPV